MSSLRPVVNPPMAPPRALPRVPVMRSTRPSTPRSSIEPRPVAPMNPVAWHSSTMTSASYRSARSQMRSIWATYPSMENTPSVTMSLVRAPAASAALSWASRSAMSLLA